MAGPAGLIATIVLGGMLTPLGEELFFRGVITRFLLRWNTAIAVILGAAIFAAAHGVNDVTPMAFIIGLGNGLLLRYSRSIWPGVAVHVTYNTIGMVIHSLGI
nr:CPBP family intramembrane glutamic endopeptidase [Schumannella luteola]